MPKKEIMVIQNILDDNSLYLMINQKYNLD